MERELVLPAIALAALCTFGLRALPFLAFRAGRAMPPWLERLGKALPSAIMAVLVVYCLKDLATDFAATGPPQVLAVLAVAATYKWRHNTLLSIAAGTLLYMLLLPLF